MHKIEGSCLCGAISFKVANAFDKLFICSCNQCRQINGSAFASNLFVTIGKFQWLSGGDGSKMVVPAGSLTGEPDVAERVRIFAAEQPSWSSGLEQVDTHPGFPQ